MLLLRMKAWQLFVILIGAMFAGQIFMLDGFLGGHEDPVAIMKPIAFYTIVVLIVFLAGMISFGINLNKLVPAEIRPGNRMFRYGIVIAGLYMVVFQLIFLNLVSTENDGNPVLLAFMVPLHMLSMFFLFYGLFFLAKNLAFAEKKERVSASFFMGDFFLFWFYPIGVWFLQPRINRLVKESIENPVS